MSTSPTLTMTITREHRAGRLVHSMKPRLARAIAADTLAEHCRVVAPLQQTAPVCPLVCVLHGHSQQDGDLARHTIDWARQEGAIVLLPRSQHGTWDLLEGGYGPDAATIDSALAWVLHTLPVDRSRVALAGFSDGASYALSLGLKHGNLFSHVLAFSPGFAMAGRRVGTPRIFVAHGAHDRVLPIDCGRGIARRLAHESYAVTYSEHAGEHEVPRQVALEGLSLLSASDRELAMVCDQALRS